MGKNDISWEKIAPGLYRIGSPVGPRYFYQYLLIGDERSLLIDTGMAETFDEAIAPFLKEIQFDPAQLDMVLISHADVDHFSGLENVKKACNPLVMASKQDVSWIESTEKVLSERYFYYESLGVEHEEGTKNWFKENLHASSIDVQLRGGEVISLGKDRLIDIIPTPGHTPGHLSVYDRVNETAIIIDAVLWKGLFDRENNIISPPPYYSVSPYLDSIDRLLTYKIDYLLTGHYGVMRKEEAYRFLYESKEFVYQTKAVIQNTVRNSKEPQSLRQILEETNKQMGPFTEMMVELVGPVYAHLLELEKEGMVFRTTKEKLPYWYS